MLSPLEMSVPAVDGLVLKGTLTYPTARPGTVFPLAVLAHQYPATRDSYGPLVRELLAAGIATLAFDQRGHGQSIVGPEGPLVVDAPEGPGLEAFGTAFVSSVGKVGFGRIDNDVVRVTGWGASQNFIDDGRLALVGASVGAPGVLLASARLPGVKAVATIGGAGVPAFGDDAPARIREATRAGAADYYFASSEGDPFEGRANVERWSTGLTRASTRLVPGAGHAMAIFYDIRDELLSFLRKALAVA
jgi:pimeloyl-ACP methyl ester carboxylesterase